MLDVDEYTWQEIRKLQIDRLDDRNVNDTLLYLLRRGLIATGSDYVKGEEVEHLVIAAVGGNMLLQAQQAIYEQPAKKGDKTLAPTAQASPSPATKPNRRYQWSPERLAKMKKDMKEKYGIGSDDEAGKPA